MALALAARPDELAVHVVHDERAAGVRRPRPRSRRAARRVLLCTSGTAAANFHPAVVEAGLSDVPMLVRHRRPAARAARRRRAADDRPDPPLRRAVRWFHDPGVARRRDAATRGARSPRRRLDARPRRGPVHLNLPFREPLRRRAPATLPPRRPRPARRTVAGRRPARRRPLAAAARPTGAA